MLSAAARSDAERWSRLLTDHLPPRELWAERVYTRSQLQYPDDIDLAEALLDGPHTDSEKTAVVFRDERVSYRVLRDRVRGLAARLTAAGVGPTDRVALRIANRPEFVAAWLAVQSMGAIGVHVSPLYRRREVVHVLMCSGASAIVCDGDGVSEMRAAREKCGTPIEIVRADEIAGSTDDLPVHRRPRDHPAVICYIASADGPLKGVVLSPADILASADSYARDVLGLTAADVCVGTVSLAWAYGLGGLLTFPLRAGATTVLVDGAINLLQTIAASRATVLFSVPTMYRMLLQHPDLSPCAVSSLRCCVSSAEPLPPSVAAAWRDATGLEIVDGFGTTEMGHICISNRPGDVRPGYLGTVVPGYDARIVDPSMRDVPDGTPGLLALRGPTGACYWGDVDAQRRAVRDGWTLSGDVCVRQDGGWIRHVRRADSLIVTAGYKVSAREVERALTDHPDVSSAQVFQIADPIRGAVLKAVVVRAGDVDAADLSDRLQRYLKSALAPFKCPREIQIV